MLKVKIENVDKLYSIVLKLRELAVIQYFISGDLFDDETYCLQELAVKADDVRFCVSDLIFHTVSDLHKLITSDDMYLKDIL